MFNQNLALIYINPEAKKILLSLDSPHSKEESDTIEIPPEITNTCKALTKESGGIHDTLVDDPYHTTIISSSDGISYSIRPLLLDRSPRNPEIVHIMVLLERVIAKHSVDFEKVQQFFNLTKREVDVIRLVIPGFSNKEISDELFVSEHTVKDHIKNIMRKVKAKSRSQIIHNISKKQVI